MSEKLLASALLRSVYVIVWMFISTMLELHFYVYKWPCFFLFFKLFPPVIVNFMFKNVVNVIN